MNVVLNNPYRSAVSVSVKTETSPSTFVTYVICPPNPFTANEIVYSVANELIARSEKMMVFNSFIL